MSAEGGAAERARIGYEAALRERDACIAELEGEIAEGVEALRKEMDELHRRGDEERVGFGLQLAAARNVKTARALLGDHDNDIGKLKAAEPWLFSASSAPRVRGRDGPLERRGGRGRRVHADEPLAQDRWSSRERGVT